MSTQRLDSLAKTVDEVSKTLDSPLIVTAGEIEQDDMMDLHMVHNKDNSQSCKQVENTLNIAALKNNWILLKPNRIK